MSFIFTPDPVQLKLELVPCTAAGEFEEPRLHYFRKKGSRGPSLRGGAAVVSSISKDLSFLMVAVALREKDQLFEKKVLRSIALSRHESGCNFVFSVVNAQAGQAYLDNPKEFTRSAILSMYNSSKNFELIQVPEYLLKPVNTASSYIKLDLFERNLYDVVSQPSTANSGSAN